jgi:ankyrin repeat protein
MMACSSGVEVDEGGMSSSQQQQQGEEEQAMERITSALMRSMLLNKSREVDFFDEEGSYTQLLQRRVGVVKLLVEEGATLAVKAAASKRPSSPLSLAANAGLLPVVECLVQPTLAALSDQSGVPPSKRELSQAIQYAARGGHVRCLRVLLHAAAGGPESEEAKAALCAMVGALNQDAIELLLMVDVPVNGRVQGGNGPVHALFSRPSYSEQVREQSTRQPLYACRWQA